MATAHLGAKNCDHQMESYIHKRRRTDETKEEEESTEEAKTEEAKTEEEYESAESAGTEKRKNRLKLKRRNKQLAEPKKRKEYVKTKEPKKRVCEWWNCWAVKQLTQPKKMANSTKENVCEVESRWTVCKRENMKDGDLID